MVLNSSIRIAIVMMMAMRSIPDDSRFGKDQLTFGHMRGVIAQQLNDAADLGHEKQPNQPRNQAMQCDLPDHLARFSVNTTEL